jgi:hypothetical protein
VIEHGPAHEFRIDSINVPELDTSFFRYPTDLEGMPDCSAPDQKQPAPFDPQMIATLFESHIDGTRHVPADRHDTSVGLYPAQAKVDFATPGIDDRRYVPFNTHGSRQRIECRYPNDRATECPGDTFKRGESHAQSRKTSWPAYGCEDIDFVDPDVRESKYQRKMLEQTMRVVMNLADGKRGVGGPALSYDHAQIIRRSVYRQDCPGFLRA